MVKRPSRQAGESTISYHEKWRLAKEEPLDLRDIAKEMKLTYKQLRRYCQRGMAVTSGRFTKGVRFPRVRLEHVRVGRTTLTTRESVRRFLTAINGG